MMLKKNQTKKKERKKKPTKNPQLFYATSKTILKNMNKIRPNVKAHRSQERFFPLIQALCARL